MTTARELTSRLADLLRHEQAAMADFLVTLADFDRRKLWRELGHTSLFSFLHRELRLSKGAAHFRKVAAELIQAFPEVVEPLRDGRLCITSVVELAKVLTPENQSIVLPRFFHCSKREAKEVSAELRPAEAAPHRDVVTAAVRRPAAAAAPGMGDVAPPVRPDEQQCLSAPTPCAHGDSPDMRPLVRPDELPLLSARTHGAAPETSPKTAGTERREQSSRDEHREPLTADLRRLHVTVSRRFLAKLDAARAALSHSHPDGSAEEILEAALDLLLAASAKRKGIVERPAAKPRQSHIPGHVPAAVKRDVWRRANGKCEWVFDSGEVCGSMERLEFDHVVPRALGGPSTIDNIRLACSGHNQLAARRAFGDRWMDQFAREPRAAGVAASPDARPMPAAPG
jgi:hypothetical protein